MIKGKVNGGGPVKPKSELDSKVYRELASHGSFRPLGFPEGDFPGFPQ